jgi:hypothetical protein
MPVSLVIIASVQWVSSSGVSTKVSATTRSATSVPKMSASRRAKARVDAIGYKPLLPTPNASPRFAGSAHDYVRAEPGGAEKNDRRPSHGFLHGVIVTDDRHKAPTTLKTNDSHDCRTVHPKNIDTGQWEPKIVFSF